MSGGRRLRVWQKLALLGVVFGAAFAVPTTLFLREVAHALAISTRASAGIQAAQASVEAAAAAGDDVAQRESARALGQAFASLAEDVEAPRISQPESHQRHVELSRELDLHLERIVDATSLDRDADIGVHLAANTAFARIPTLMNALARSHSQAGERFGRRARGDA